MNGFVVLNKEEGLTSFKAASLLRKIYDEKKTGHTGTLDPMATGVLPVALGKATRFIDFLPASDKAYRAHMRFGIETDTLDITGTVLSSKDAHVSKEQIEEILPMFRGTILQTPPMYSALSQNGVKLYKLARQGVEVERTQREVNIHSLMLSSELENGDFEISVRCSKGTYIRSLISDIGEKLGCGAVMTALERTEANGFSISDALTLASLRENPMEGIKPIDFPFMCYPQTKVTPAQAARFSNGGELFTERLHGIEKTGIYRVYSQTDIFLGLGEISAEDTSLLKVKRVIGNDNN